MKCEWHWSRKFDYTHTKENEITGKNEDEDGRYEKTEKTKCREIKKKNKEFFVIQKLEQCWWQKKMWNMLCTTLKLMFVYANN